MEDQRFAILLKEWEMCEAAIGRFDALHFQIRGWAASAAAVLSAAAFSLHKPELLFVSVASTATLWVTEALHKTYQDVFIARSRHIQTYLRGDSSTQFRVRNGELFSYPIVGRQFKERKNQPLAKRSYRLFRAFFQAVVALPYLLMISLSLGAWYFVPNVDRPSEIKVVGRTLIEGPAISPLVEASEANHNLLNQDAERSSRTDRGAKP